MDSLPRPCSIEGCKTRIHAKNLCNTHYRQLLKKRTTIPPVRTTEERFFEKVDKNGPFSALLKTRCWSWKPGVNKVGPRRFLHQGEKKLAHNFSSTLHNGQIPYDATVKQMCNNSKCVNPDHLQLSAYHNETGSPTYYAWASMLSRCRCPNDPGYKDYGGRGITYDPRWSDFSTFLQDMGLRPDGLTLDRKDNERGYSKGNCRWATPKQQARNRRSNVVVTIRGETKTAIEWCESSGIDHSTFRWRIRNGWAPERLLEPINAKYRRLRG